VTLREAVAERLLADDAVSALVGSRVRPVQAGQADGLPCLVYRFGGRERTPTIDGGADGANLRGRALSLACYADADAEAQALGEAALACLSAAGDGWLASTDGTILLKGAFLADEADGDEPPRHGEGLAPYRVDVDLTLWYSDSEGG
jgi:hypothetical protein